MNCWLSLRRFHREVGRTRLFFFVMWCRKQRQRGFHRRPRPRTRYNVTCRMCTCPLVNFSCLFRHRSIRRLHSCTATCSVRPDEQISDASRAVQANRSWRPLTSHKRLSCTALGLALPLLCSRVARRAAVSNSPTLRARRDGRKRASLAADVEANEVRRICGQLLVTTHVPKQNAMAYIRQAPPWRR